MIEIRLEKWEKCVIMQILKQEGIEKGFTFCGSKMSILSCAEPHLGHSYVYIRGYFGNDFIPSMRMFEDNILRDEYYDKVVELFQEYNNRNKSKKSENNIFILE